MPYRYVIDTFAWVEYFIGSSKGKSARRYIESGRAATPSIVFLELRKWFLREIEARRRTLEGMNDAFDFAESATQIVDLDEKLAKSAGETDFLMKKKLRNWPMVDSIVYTVAKEGGALVITGDTHFKSLENVIML